MTEASLEIQRVARDALATIAGRSGRLLYSAASTLCPGDIYLLGLNPGGDPTCHEKTLSADIEDLPNAIENAYCDQSWRSRPAGQSTLQRRIRWLLEALGQNPRAVCASNLIFLRSVDASGCEYPKAADVCWPVHERILEEVRPQLILVFGNSAISPFQYLRDRYKPKVVGSFASGHGNWRCLAFQAAGRAVIGLPHLSRYAVDRYPDVPAWIQRYANLKAAM